ncbi:MAG: hypothetical protein HeimC3_10800 [Candidatus Heimdallarchaeota archaeon LC_3]|nr:MAG: hypothetical protein HeimC3_10800 [Candidatus Heimdallarchaeota archaeon LC_3]
MKKYRFFTKNNFILGIFLFSFILVIFPNNSYATGSFEEDVVNNDEGSFITGITVDYEMISINGGRELIKTIIINTEIDVNESGLYSIVGELRLDSNWVGGYAEPYESFIRASRAGKYILKYFFDASLIYAQLKQSFSYDESDINKQEISLSALFTLNQNGNQVYPLTSSYYSYDKGNFPNFTTISVNDLWTGPVILIDSPLMSIIDINGDSLADGINVHLILEASEKDNYFVSYSSNFGSQTVSDQILRINKTNSHFDYDFFIPYYYINQSLNFLYYNEFNLENIRFIPEILDMSSSYYYQGFSIEEPYNKMRKWTISIDENQFGPLTQTYYGHTLDWVDINNDGYVEGVNITTFWESYHLSYTIEMNGRENNYDMGYTYYPYIYRTEVNEFLGYTQFLSHSSYFSVENLDQDFTLSYSDFIKYNTEIVTIFLPELLNTQTFLPISINYIDHDFNLDTAVDSFPSANVSFETNTQLDNVIVLVSISYREGSSFSGSIAQMDYYNEFPAGKKQLQIKFIPAYSGTSQLTDVIISMSFFTVIAERGENVNNYDLFIQIFSGTSKEYLIPIADLTFELTYSQLIDLKEFNKKYFETQQYDPFSHLPPKNLTQLPTMDNFLDLGGKQAIYHYNYEFYPVSITEEFTIEINYQSENNGKKLEGHDYYMILKYPDFLYTTPSSEQILLLPENLLYSKSGQLTVSNFFFPTNVKIGTNYSYQAYSAITPVEYSTYRLGNKSYQTLVFQEFYGMEYHVERKTGILLAMGYPLGIILELDPESSILELVDSSEIELIVFGISLPNFSGIFVALFFSMGGLSAGVALAYVAKIIGGKKS